MILISFIYNREILNFAIQDKIIKYTDRKWGKWIQCIPKDKNFIMKVKMSRGSFPYFLIKMFDLNKKEQEEYDNAKTDEELSNIVIKDARSKGCKLLYKKVENLNEGWQIEGLYPKDNTFKDINKQNTEINISQKQNGL